jgi:hypothetical protein
MTHFLVTLPVTNDLPALTVVTVPVITESAESALDYATEYAASMGYELDTARAPTVDVD